jgi:hypothetical protein
LTGEGLRSPQRGNVGGTGKEANVYVGVGTILLIVLIILLVLWVF